LRGDWAKRYRRAFLSYASEDRLEVFRSAQTIPALGINFFQDILSLEPGEVWQNRLRQEIADCDVFLLYWSTHAANSKWVAWEIDQALSLQEERALYKPDIKPVIIEGPPVPPPPKTLAHLHFQSLMRYLIAAEAAEHARQVPPADALMPD
jgi:hypothetical protein